MKLTLVILYSLILSISHMAAEETTIEKVFNPKVSVALPETSKPENEELDFPDPNEDFEDHEEEEDEDREEIDFEELEKFFSLRAPPIHQHYYQLREEDEEEAEDFLHHAIDIYHTYHEYQDMEPAYARLYLDLQVAELKSNLLGHELREINHEIMEDNSQDLKNEYSEIRSELKTLLSNLFEHKLKLQKAELEFLLEEEELEQGEINEWQSHIKKREQFRTKIIEHRLGQLSGELDYLDWYN